MHAPGTGAKWCLVHPLLAESVGRPHVFFQTQNEPAGRFPLRAASFVRSPRAADTHQELAMKEAKFHQPESVSAPIDLHESKAWDPLYQGAEEFRVLFELCPIATYAIDADGVIVRFNDLAAKLWGRAPVLGDTNEKFCGSHQMYLLDGTPLRHDECLVAQVVSGATSIVIDAQVMIERPDGSRVTLIVNIRPLRDARGVIVGAINCFYEVSCPISIADFRKRTAESPERR